MTGLTAAVAFGAVMGFLISAVGGGGSLFTIPILLIVFHQSITLATGTSLVVVFAAALVGAFGHARRGRVLPRVTLFFGGASMVGAAIGALLHGWASERVVVATLGATLIVAAIRMLAGSLPVSSTGGSVSLWRISPLGFVLGVLTGFVGVGGGFLIVPVLVWGAGLALRDAIGTSLSIIALSSLSGALTHVSAGNVDPELALWLAVGSVAGALVGAPMSGKLPERPLRIGFAALALVAAGYVFLATSSR